MPRESKIFDKLLIYKNYRLFVVVLYSIISILIFLNKNYFFEHWIEGFGLINSKFEEPLSYLIFIYYVIFSFYGALSLFYPLTILDKKYNKNHQLKIKFPEINRENLFNASGNILLLIAFPFLSAFGFLIWFIFVTTLTSLGYILNIILFIFIGIFTIYILIVFLVKIIKIIYKLFPTKK